MNSMKFQLNKGEEYKQNTLRFKHIWENKPIFFRYYLDRAHSTLLNYTLQTAGLNKIYVYYLYTASDFLFDCI